MKKSLLGCAFAAISLSAIAQPCDPPRLLAHWDFNNGSYTDLLQGWTGVANGGTISQVPGRAGVANTAINFDGASWLQVPHDNAMDLQSWTITAVVRPTAFNTAACQGNAIVWRGAQVSGSHYNLHFTDNPWDAVNTAGNPCVNNGGNYTFTSGAALSSPPPATDPVTSAEWLSDVNVNPFITLDRWYCVTASYNGATEIMDLYVDGVHIVSESWTNWYNYSGSNDLFIGASDNAGSGMFEYFFTGDIDDIKLYDEAVNCTDAQFLDITKIVCATCPERLPNEIAHWDFNSGNLSDIINGWAPTAGSNPPPPGNSVSGILGAANTAMRFNQGHFLEFAADPLMDTKSWTIAAIVRPNPSNYWTGPCQGNSILWLGRSFSDKHYHLEFFDNYVNSANDCNTALPDKLFAGFPAGTATWTGDKWNSGSDPAWTGSPWFGTANPFIDNTPPGRWYCVALSYDHVTGFLDLYVDGDHVFHQWVADQYTTTTPWNEALYIGRSAEPTPYEYFFDGDLDDVILYDGPLTCSPECIREGEPKPTAIDAFRKAGSLMQVVPNPATNNISVTIPADWGKGQIILVNAVGQQVLSKAMETTNAKIDISSLPAGVYILKAQFGSNTASQKVLKN